MTLQAPQGFAGGPLTDDSWGAISSRGAWVENAAAYAVTQPNTGTRSIAIAGGNAVAHGVRVPNDAAITQALTAPGSGGQWYLIALRRDWTAGQKTCSLQVLTGPSTGSTTAPTVIPASVPANMQSASGTAQADQPLAWVWVSSATTTLTIFDLRMQRTTAGSIAAGTLWALVFASLAGHLQDGAIVPVLRHTLPSGGVHISSRWQRDTTAGGVNPVGDITVNDGGISGATGAALRPNLQSASMTDIQAIAQGVAGGLGFTAWQTAIFETNSRSRWIWDTSAKFKPWDWAALLGFDSENGSSIDTNGGDSETSIVGGVVHVRFNLYRGGGLGTNTAYGRMWPGLRPAYAAHGSGGVYGSNVAGASFVVDSTGGIYFDAATGASGPNAMRGFASFRAVN